MLAVAAPNGTLTVVVCTLGTGHTDLGPRHAHPRHGVTHRRNGDGHLIGLYHPGRRPDLVHIDVETAHLLGHFQCTWTSGPLTCTITGLTNGDTYMFTVTATNAVGTGAALDPSDTVTPHHRPRRAHAIVTRHPGRHGDGHLDRSVLERRITDHRLHGGAADSTTPANGGESCTWTTGPLTCTITGLTNGDTYSFTVTATNAVGTGAALHPLGHGHPGITVPGAPTIVTVTQPMPSATVTWTAPSSNGGSPITAYTVAPRTRPHPANGGESCTWTTGPLTCTITGLTNGDTYSFTVTATNAVGTGPASRPRAPVTPTTVPGAPTIVTRHPPMPRRRSPSAPPRTAGSPITAYTVAPRTRPHRPTAVSRAPGRRGRSPARSPD